MVMTYKKMDKKLDNDFWKTKNLSLSIGEVSVGKPKQELDEPMGPTPKPSVTDLRSWDFKLLKRYPPFYAPFCDMCCLCTYGKCDLLGKKGACGIDAKAQQARTVLLASCIGTAAHAGHGRHMLHHVIKEKGKDFPIDMGKNIDIEAPIIRTIIGKKPVTVSDLDESLSYVEEQLSHLLSACHTGQEGNSLDFESKALHAGMMDDLAREVADITQIVAYDMPRGDGDEPLVELGLGTVDKDKPVVLCIGHNVAPGAEILDYI
jgi:acetyl-CoA decarbonylase/synthase complex subunit alpha